jgi:hypothetical protein
MRTVTPFLFALGLCVLPPALAASSAATARVERHALAPAKLGLESTERAALRAASRSTPELGAARAGDFSLHLSDHDLTVIAVTAVVVLILIAIF